MAWRAPRGERCRAFPEAPRWLSWPSSLLNELGDEGCPPGLMARSEPGAAVAVEVLVKWNQVVPVRVGLQAFGPAEDGTAPRLVLQEYPRQPMRDFLGDLPERHHPPGSRRALHRVAVAEVVVELLERLDEQEVDRKPDRSAPVRVAPEEPTGGFGRLVVHPVLRSIHPQDVR